MDTTGIIGHNHQLQKLTAMVENNKIPQALLFSGPSGIGKLKVAHQFIKSLFCTGTQSPCNNCRNCLTVENRTHPDFIQIDPDNKGKIAIGDSHKKERGSIRWLIDRLSKKNISGRTGIIINGIELISSAGQNALLKTIEEPQPGTIIILLTSNKSLILPTILSRTTELSFSPLKEHELEQLLNADEESRIIIKLANGSLETANLLQDRSIFSSFFEICSDISKNANNGSMISLEPLGPLLKKIGPEKTITILINIYRTLLLSHITNREPEPELKPVDIDNNDKIQQIIKILLALKKGISHNLNIRMSLKGKLYTLDNKRTYYGNRSC